MIRKFARLDAPAKDVHRLFTDIDGWPQWMPGITGVRTIEDDGARRVVALRQSFMGRAFAAKVEIRIDPGGLRERQLSGWLKRWDSHWRFVPRPEDGGTTLSLELHIDLGLARLLISQRTVQRTINDLFRQAVDRSQRRLRSQGTPAAVGPVADREGETLVQVFRTGAGLEIWIAGRRYTLAADDA